MKKIVSLALVLMLCLGMTLTASAATNFVPSVSYDSSTFLINAEMDGKEVTDCVVVTTIDEAKDKSTDIKQEERDELLKKYEDIKGGEKLPADGWCILHLVDLSFEYEDCRVLEDHGRKDEWLAEEGNTIEMDFDLDVPAGKEVRVMVWVDGQWKEVPGVVNNGDGTVTVVFEEICPVAFMVECPAASNVPQTGDSNGAQLMLWGGVFGACVLGLIAVVIVFSRKRKHA